VPDEGVAGWSTGGSSALDPVGPSPSSSRSTSSLAASASGQSSWTGQLDPTVVTSSLLPYDDCDTVSVTAFQTVESTAFVTLERTVMSTMTVVETRDVPSVMVMTATVTETVVVPRQVLMTTTVTTSDVATVTSPPLTRTLSLTKLLTETVEVTLPVQTEIREISQTSTVTATATRIVVVPSVVMVTETVDGLVSLTTVVETSLVTVEPCTGFEKTFEAPITTTPPENFDDELRMISPSPTSQHALDEWAGVAESSLASSSPPSTSPSTTTSLSTPPSVDLSSSYTSLEIGLITLVVLLFFILFGFLFYKFRLYFKWQGNYAAPAVAFNASTGEVALVNHSAVAYHDVPL
jgi:hypothetical protein